MLAQCDVAVPQKGPERFECGDHFLAAWQVKCTLVVLGGSRPVVGDLLGEEAA